jgi:uncharacterized protein (DUF58 family)
LKLTRAGVVYVGMTLLLGFGAVNTGNNLLYLLVSALLGFMAISGWLGQRNLRGLKLSLVPPREIFVGQPTLIGVRIENRRRRLPAFLIRVELGEEKPLFPHVGAADHEERTLLLSFAQRGYHQIDSLWLSSCFPINFFVRSLKVPLNQRLVAFPQPQPATAPPASGHSEQRQQQTGARNGDSGDLRSISDYVGGEPLKSIHWKLSARHDTFKVKQQEGLAARPLIIDLEQLGGSLEQRIGYATGLAINQLRHQQPVGLKLAGKLIPPQAGNGQRRRLLTELALYDGR